MASGDTSTTTAGNVYLQGGKTGGENSGEKRKEGAIQRGQASRECMRIAAEEILFLHLWAVPEEDRQRVTPHLFPEEEL